MVSEVKVKKKSKKFKMSSGGEATTTATNTATTNTATVGNTQMPQMSSLPSGIPMPKPLNLDNIAANWKKLRRAS